MINPWTYYIINDKMPNIYPEDPKDSDKMVKSLLVSLLVCFIWGAIMYISAKYLIGFGNPHFCEWYLLVIALSIVGMIYSIKWVVNWIWK